MRFYLAEKTPEGATVEVIDRDNAKGGYQLPNDTPLPFDFGTPGPGTAQLALALLADALGTNMAFRHYKEFKNKILAPMEGDSFELSEEDILQFVADIKRTAGRRV